MYRTFTIVQWLFLAESPWLSVKAWHFLLQLVLFHMAFCAAGSLKPHFIWKASEKNTRRADEVHVFKNNSFFWKFKRSKSITNQNPFAEGTIESYYETLLFSISSLYHPLLTKEHVVLIFKFIYSTQSEPIIKKKHLSHVSNEHYKTNSLTSVHKQVISNCSRSKLHPPATQNTLCFIFSGNGFKTKN